MLPPDLDHDTPPRSSTLTDEEVAQNQADRDPGLAWEMETAKRVADACAHAGDWFKLACPSCIAAYAQQLRADRRLMREALEREQEANKALREQNAALVAALLDITPPMPPRDAICHDGILPQERCPNCQRIAGARAAIAKATGGAS